MSDKHPADSDWLDGVSPYAQAFTEEELDDFWGTHAGDNPDCDTCRWLLTLADHLPKASDDIALLRGGFTDGYKTAQRDLAQKAHPVIEQRLADARRQGVRFGEMPEDIDTGELASDILTDLVRAMGDGFR